MSDEPLYHPYNLFGVRGGSIKAEGLTSGCVPVSISSLKAWASAAESEVEIEALLIAMLPFGVVDTVAEAEFNGSASRD